MSTWRRAVSGNAFSKIAVGLGTMLLLFAPPTARSGRAAEVYDFQICHGYFALCAASTCKPTGGQITVRTATGGTATFPEADWSRTPLILRPAGHPKTLASGKTLRDDTDPDVASEFARDSPLEGSGFELLVPRSIQLGDVNAGR